jgi:YVTN family beta-propeller protein
MRHSRLLSLLGTITFALATAGCSKQTPDIEAGTLEATRLPTGRLLDPAVPSVPLRGAFPLGVLIAPDSNHLAVLTSGYGTQGVEIVDRRSGAARLSLSQPAAFVGIALSPDRATLYASGGNQDVVYRYAISGGVIAQRDSLRLTSVAKKGAGTRYPAGLATSLDGTQLYVAENLADSLAVIDVATGRVTARFATERYPYGVVVGNDGTVFVSSWGGTTVSAFRRLPDGRLELRGRIPAGRHPSALLLNADGTRLFVASASTDRVTVLDTRTGETVARLADAPPAGPGEGSTPNALALSADGKVLFVAEADNNAVAVFSLSASTSGVSTAVGRDTLAGRIPTDWYPTGLLVVRDSLIVLSAKGKSSMPNPLATQPGVSGPDQPLQYTLGQLTGSIASMRIPMPGSELLSRYTARVARANGWDVAARTAPSYPPIEHVIYLIKENRTYDQVFGDLPQGDGDKSLVFFGRDVSPNHHAIAERFGIYDRFFVNAEVSADGHNWSMAAYATDYVEKTVQSTYSGRGRSYDYEGTNRQDEDLARDATVIPEDDVNEPANGYLWNLAERAGITFRNYGEFVVAIAPPAGSKAGITYRGAKPYLAAHTDEEFPGFDLTIPDQRRADIWIDRLAQYTKAGKMPALQILRLPNDHTEGASKGRPTPRVHMADNDLALGRVIEALSKSPFWKSTAVFVLEDDAQDGPDHVDSHRSPLLVISPWAKPGVNHRWANTTDVIATIADILHLGSLSQFDYYGTPLRNVWRTEPDLRPYTALTPSVDMNERTASNAPGVRESAGLDLRGEDRINDDLFNRILWKAVKGEGVPYPGVNRASAPEWAGAQRTRAVEGSR